MSSKVQEFINQLKGKNIHIVGFSGTESAAIALFLDKHGVTGFHLHDFSQETTVKKHFRNAHSALNREEQDERLEAILNLPAIFHYQDSYLYGIEDADIIFVPQSWYMYESNSKLKELNAAKFLHITKLYFQLTDAKIIGITGSNGKTTTSNLINHLLSNSGILKAEGRKIYFSGNDRGTTQILENIEEITEKDILVLEISNRQLKIDLGQSPHIGVITNITPNHLKEYNSFEEYKEGKLSILKHQTANDFAVLNCDDEHSSGALNKENLFGFSTKKELEKGCFLEGEWITITDQSSTKVCKISELQMKGEHNISNTCAAFVACYLSGMPTEELAEHIKTFTGVAQRQELIVTIQGVEYYNDSACTAPESVVAALDALKENIILIAGGRSKVPMSSEMIQKIESSVKYLFLLESPFADELEAELSEEFKAKIHKEQLLKQAVRKAAELAKPGDKIILSPGAEYFVYFKDHMPGYKNFRTFVRQLEE